MKACFASRLCGVTKRSEAEAAVEAGADAIGLNFYPGSRRCLKEDCAAGIAQAIPRVVSRVGVFVNATTDEVCGIAERLKLDLVQLAGDEPPEMLKQLASRQVIKAIRLRLDSNGALQTGSLVDFVRSANALKRRPTMILLDAHLPGEFGGTGRTLDWPALAESLVGVREALGDMLPPLVLAGGLSPSNVAEAIATVRPDAVDVASGVESAAGARTLSLCVALCRRLARRSTGSRWHRRCATASESQAVRCDWRRTKYRVPSTGHWRIAARFPLALNPAPLLRYFLSFR